MTAASAALDTACVFTFKGSITPAFCISNGLPSYTSRPKVFFPDSCAARIATIISIASRPAFSASACGMTSSAFANASIASWFRPPMVAAYRCSWSES